MAEIIDPFSLAVICNRGEVRNVLGGLGLQRVIAALQDPSLNQRLLARPESPDDILQASRFLRGMADSLDQELVFFNISFPSPHRAYPLGVCIAAATIENTAREHSTFDPQLLDDALLERADSIIFKGAGQEPAILDAAYDMLDDQKRRERASALVERFVSDANATPMAQAAFQAVVHLFDLTGGDGSSAALSYNPWDKKTLNPGLRDSTAIRRMTWSGKPEARSDFAIAMRAATAGDTVSLAPDAIPEEHFSAGVKRTLACVALGAMYLSVPQADQTG
jgi:hypothetical protein